MNINSILSRPSDIADTDFISKCKAKLDEQGALVLPEFLSANSIEIIREQSAASIDDAYFCASKHNVYLLPADDEYDQTHPRNREVVSSKGLIGDDQIGEISPLKILYEDKDFQHFIASLVGEEALYPYADPLSSVNVHYAREGQELGWHFDNSSFAVTLLIDKPESGGKFEYVKDLRNANVGEFNYDGVQDVLDGKVTPAELEMEPGTLVLFRGRNSLHRVTPTIGGKTRMLAVLAYNSEPGISLSESARMTFYGRLN